MGAAGEAPPAPASPGAVWVDGALRPIGDAVVDARDSAYATGLGCYTTTRWSRGRAWSAPAHAERLARDARALGLGAIDPGRVLRALDELGRAAFGEAEGVLRIQASRDGGGRIRLVGVPRGLGDDPGEWRAVRAPFPHPGPQPFGGAKRSGDPLLALAREHARRAGAQEVLLLDAGGRLVEGARTSAIVVLASGEARTPPLARGGVRSVARAQALAALGGISGIIEADVDGAALRDAREIVLVNAVRGAVPLVALDASPIGDGRAGPWCARLAAVLADASGAGC
jgi:branched-subunit amino acid aminotransferase/4-amino-4-deoxychorismate lyase